MTKAMLRFITCDKTKMALAVTTWYCFFGLTAKAQKEPFTSRFYFPALIGLNIPDNDNGFKTNSGFNLNTAVEYRPMYTNAMFYRFNYDAVGNKYLAKASAAPTNAIKAKMQISFFNIGVGYRVKIKRMNWYVLAQPGLALTTFNKVLPLNNNFEVTQVNTRNFNLKLCLGAEYYIVPHFAIIAEPSFYRLTGGATLPNNSIFNINIGFTTTLF